MTISTTLRAAGELLGSHGMSGFGVAIVVGGVGQLLGGVLFVVNMWFRVRMPTVVR